MAQVTVQKRGKASMSSQKTNNIQGPSYLDSLTQ